MRIHVRLLFGGLALALGYTAAVLGAGSASAQVPSPSVAPGAGPTVQLSALARSVSPAIQAKARRAFRGHDLKGKDGPMAKMGRDLATLYYQYEAKGAAGIERLVNAEEKSQQTLRARFYSPVSADGRYVTINAVAAGGSAQLLSDLRGLGLRGGAHVGRVVSGQLPIGSLRAAAQLSSLRGALPSYAQVHVGRVSSEADTAHRAFKGRKNLGVDGSGQKVCALSDSYDQDSGAATSASDDIQSGDLPGKKNPDGRTTPVDVLDDGVTTGSDEGRAMLQLIHDIAPGATLGFHTAFNGVANFAQGIRELADAGCTVIVDDVGYSVEPFYQDGPVSNAVDDVMNNDDVAYFSSAGNSGQDAYEAPFRNSGKQGVTVPTAVTHDFDPGAAVDTLQKIEIDVQGNFRIFSFQWTDPSTLVEGSAGADTDLDIFLLNDTLGVVASSADNSDQDGTGVPVESLEFSNGGSINTDNDSVPDSTFHFAISKTAGPDPDSVRYVHMGSGFEIKEHHTLGATIFGHPMAKGAMAVAAAPFYNTEQYNPNADPAALEAFSSKGGIPILFDQAGNRLSSPQSRPKPDVTGTDGIDNTFFGSDISDTFFNGVDGDNAPNFFGTSAAAPNVAAIAALVREANPGFTASDVYDHLEQNAEDVTTRLNRNGTFVSIGSGHDPWSGHGFVEADAAALPVELARLEVTAKAKTAVLTWTTASETNNAGFAVEHRAGDGAFHALAFIESKAQGGTTSSPHIYRYRTAELPVGPHTFRLRQKDLDGRSTFSKTVTLQLRLSGKYSVSAVTPNPVRATGTVTVTVQSAQEVRASVYDMLGRRVAVVHDGPIPANDPTTIRVGASLRSGVYLLRIRGTSFAATRKFVRIQ